jgi:CheY-like chemotaxis protein
MLGGRACQKQSEPQETTRRQRHLRIMLVDDHELVRSGISSMLSSTDDLHLVAEAETAAEAIRGAERERPDVIVMDIRLLEGSGSRRHARSALACPDAGANAHFVCRRRGPDFQAGVGILTFT